MKIIYIYLIIINALGLLLMRADKQKARKNLWRIPEKVLFGTAVLGGSMGIYLGMQLFRHKTKHLSFTIGIPLILSIQCIAAVVLYSLYA